MTTRKYELTDETLTIERLMLHRIKRLSDGALGGWIEKEENLSQDGNAWVSGDARVSGDALVSGNAQVYGGAWVYGNALVYGNARVYGGALVYGNARVYGDAASGTKIELPGHVVPIVENLQAEILEALESGGELEMSAWHKCETTHCRAGWAIYLAGEAGAALEKKYGAWLAGAAIEMASTPALKQIPNYFADNDAALVEIKALATSESKRPENA